MHNEDGTADTTDSAEHDVTDVSSSHAQHFASQDSKRSCSRVEQMITHPTIQMNPVPLILRTELLALAEARHQRMRFRHYSNSLMVNQAEKLASVLSSTSGMLQQKVHLDKILMKRKSIPEVRRPEKSPSQDFSRSKRARSNAPQRPIKLVSLAPSQFPSQRTKESKWFSSYQELKAYKEIHGDCLVPRGYADNAKLANFVAEQRKQYKLLKDGKQSSINSERIALLEELNFSWNAQEAAWEKHIQNLQRFRAEHGHCHVPLNDQKYPKLGLWVKEQRRHYSKLKQGKHSNMNTERIKTLTELGFCWDTHEAIWLERFRELVDFKMRFGSCAVPASYTENQKLATWIQHQRRQYKKHKSGKSGCHITKERIEALEGIGFIWFPRERQTSASFSGIISASSSEEDLDDELTTTGADPRPCKRRRLSND